MNRNTRLILIISLFIALSNCTQLPNNTYYYSGLSTTTVQSTVPGKDSDTPKPPNTVSPTQPFREIKSSPTILPTEITSIQGPSGILYTWIYRYLDPLYTSVDLSTSNFPVLLSDRANPKVIDADGKLVVGLAFAPYSPLVAYMTKTSKSIDLWLADLNLENIVYLHKIDSGWLGSLTNPGDVSIKWGPSDSALLLSSYLAQDHLIIYSFKEKTLFNTVGACDQIAPLPGTDQLTVWCTFDKGAPSAYAYFALDGNIVFTETKPEQGVEVFEWAFAPGDNRLAYLPKQGNLTIAANPVNSLEISARLLNEPGDFKTMPFLQWSENGKLLLVYGYNQNYCPLLEDPVSGNLEAKECWQVVDSVSGGILWGPNMNAKEINKTTGFPLAKLFSPCAGLSPNNDWLVLCYRSGAVDGTILVALNDNEKVIDLSTGMFLDFKWLSH